MNNEQLGNYAESEFFSHLRNENLTLSDILGCSLVAECLPSMPEAQRPSPSTA